MTDLKISIDSEKRDNENPRPPRRQGEGGRPVRFRQDIQVSSNEQDQPNTNREGGEVLQQGAFAGGFRRGGSAGGRGGRGGAFGGRGGYMSRRRTENEKNERDFDRHSGSDKT